MLAVDVEQAVADLAQLRGRGGAAIDPAAAAALEIDRAAQEQRIAGFEAAGVQPRGEIRIGVEFDAHVQAFSALAHRTRVGAVAQRELQGVDEDRLARAGLAGQHGEAGGEVDVERAHDHEIAQGDASQCHQRSWKCGDVVGDRMGARTRMV